jgi:sec-independent protein translocase protein TatB
MFGISWNEYIVIAIVALIVIGPKELPGVLRAVGQWTAKIRRMAAEFQGQFQEAMREAEMADLKKEVDNIHDTARGLTSQLEHPINFQDATKWEPKAEQPDLKSEPAPETSKPDQLANPPGASPESAPDPAQTAAPAPAPAASEHPVADMVGAAAAPSSDGSAPKADGGAHA